MSTTKQTDAGTQPSATTINGCTSQHVPQRREDGGDPARGAYASAATTQPELVPIAKLNRTIQVRAARNDAHAKAIAELMKQGHGMLPIEVFLDPTTGKMWRADGEHRTRAREINKETHVLANIHIGTRRDALDFALKCDLGLPRNDDDKQLCIRLRLEDPEWAQRSDRLIALQFGCDHKTVGNIRRQLGVPQPATRIGADGKVRKLPAPTGEIPQLVGRKSEESAPSTDEQIVTAVVQNLESQEAPPLARQAEAIRLIESMLGDSNPDVMREIRDYIAGPVGADASVDVVTMIAFALARGFDSLARSPESERYLRTPRQCAELIKDVTSAIDARSYTVPTDSPRKLDTVDYMQQVIGANIMSPDEVHVALKSIGRMPACNDPVHHIRFLLSFNRKVFLRIEGKDGLVGVYLADDNPYRLGTSIFAIGQSDVTRELLS